MKIWIGSLLMTLLPLAAHAGERFACNMNALSRAERASHTELSEALRAAVQEQRELKKGFSFRLPPDALVDAARWVALERRCCPFFTFGFEVGRDGGPVWLSITGANGVKAFIRAELGLES